MSFKNYMYIEGTQTLFEDAMGNLLTGDQLDYLPAWEIEERKIHVCEKYA